MTGRRPLNYLVWGICQVVSANPTSAIRRVKNGYTIDFPGISYARSALHGVSGGQARETACEVIFGGRLDRNLERRNKPAEIQRPSRPSQPGRSALQAIFAVACFQTPANPPLSCRNPIHFSRFRRRI